MKLRGLCAGVIALSLATGSAAFAAETAPAAPATPPAEVTNAPAAQPAPVAAAPAPAPAPAAATPLATRPAKPLQLQPKDEGTPFGYKLLAGLGLAAAAGLWLHKKKKGAEGTVEKKKKAGTIDILSRKSFGVRNELLVIDVEGTRLLVGMTPGAMQTLAVLDQPESLTEVSDDVKTEVESRPAIQRVPEPVAAAASDEDEDDLPPVSYVPPKPRAADTANVAALDQKVRSLLAARPEPKQTNSMTVPKPQRRRANNAKTARIAGQAKGLLLAMNEESDTLARTGEI